MEKKLLLISNTVGGRVEYNDGAFAEVQTVRVEGIETSLLIATIQIHRCETGYQLEQFCRKFPVGRRLEIFTTTEISILRGEKLMRTLAVYSLTSKSQ